MVPLFFCNALIKSDMKSGCPPAPPPFVIKLFCWVGLCPVLSLLIGGFGGSFFTGSCGGADLGDSAAGGGGGGGGGGPPALPTFVICGGAG